jgi:CHASE1-domain containing sensor protein/nitrogen-specific signal transduction histidine kinase
MRTNAAYAGDTGAQRFTLATRTIVVAVAGAALSFILYAVIHDWGHERIRRSIDENARQIIESIDLRFKAAQQTVKAIKGLYEASGSIERHEFKRFVSTVAGESKGVQALEWIPRVTLAEREKFEAAARRDGFPDFKFWQKNDQGRMGPSPSKPEYFPVYFVEPFAGNEAAFGFDLGSNPARLKALRSARLSGEVRLTERITLVQETAKQFGVLMVQPVYERGAAVKTVQDRRASLRGFVLGVFRMSDLAASVADKASDHAGKLRTFVFDQSAPAGSRRLYPRFSPYEARAEISDDNCRDQAMAIGGRKWLIAVCANPDAETYQTSWLSWLTLASGLLTTLLIVGYVELIIRQRRRSESMMAEIRDSQESLANAQRIAHIGNWDWDIGANEIRWSDEVYRIFGQDRDQFTGAFDAFLDIVHGDDRDLVKRTLTNAVMEKSECVVEHRVALPDGLEKFVREKGEIECDDEGRVVRMRGTVQDFTELRAAENRLLEAKKMEAVGQLSGGVAHEFNNIFAVIVGHLEMIGLKGKNDPEIEKHTSPSMDAAMRGADLNNRLLSFARKQALSPRVIDPAARIAAMKENIAAALGDDIKWHFDTPKNLWRVHADPDKFDDALMNIANNARDAMPDGGSFSIALANITLMERDEIGDMENGDYVVISLLDTGVGMAPDVLAQAYQPFFTTSGEVVGRGLGLSMVHGFAVQSGGGLTVESEEGSGTTVRLYLPGATGA